jgi:hypothetical protein
MIATCRTQQWHSQAGSLIGGQRWIGFGLTLDRFDQLRIEPEFAGDLGVWSVLTSWPCSPWLDVVERRFGGDRLDLGSVRRPAIGVRLDRVMSHLGQPGRTVVSVPLESLSNIIGHPDVKQLIIRVVGAVDVGHGTSPPPLDGGDRPKQRVYLGEIDTNDALAETVRLEVAAGDQSPDGVHTDRVAFGGSLDRSEPRSFGWCFPGSGHAALPPLQGHSAVPDTLALSPRRGPLSQQD